MNGKLSEAANDIRWLKQTIETNALSNSADHKLILEHLQIINGGLGTSKGDIAVCKKDINRLWWVVGIIVVGIFGIAWKALGG